jgi:hypothetical protein
MGGVGRPRTLPIAGGYVGDSRVEASGALLDHGSARPGRAQPRAQYAAHAREVRILEQELELLLHLPDVHGRSTWRQASAANVAMPAVPDAHVGEARLTTRITSFVAARSDRDVRLSS